MLPCPPLLSVVYRFDPVYPTCYKCPFCAGEPELGVYIPLVFFYKGLRRLKRRKLRRGQAQHP